MQPKVLTSSFFVGLFALLTLGSACIYVAFLSRGEQGIGPHVQIQVRFRNVSGLRPGSEVKLAGFRIGSVGSISINSTPEEGPYYLVILRIRDKASTRHWLREDSSITIASTNLLGDKHIEIGFGSEESAPLQPDTTLLGRDPIQIGSVLDELMQTLANVKTISLALRKGLVGEEGSADNFSLLASNLRTASSNLMEVSEGLAQLVTGGEMGGVNVHSILLDLKEAAADIGEISKLVRTSISGPSGEPADLHRMITNLEKTAENTASASQDLRNLLGQNEGPPVNIHTTLQDIEESAGNLRDITNGLKRILPDKWFEK